MPIDWKTIVRSRLPTQSGGRPPDDEVVEELAQFLADRVEDMRAAGLTAEAAQAQALAELEPLQERRNAARLSVTRDTRRPLAALGRDLAYAGRLVARSPGYSAVVVLTLALAIGATTAAFSVVQGVLLRPLPYEDPGRIVFIWESSPQGNTHNVVSSGNYFDWRERARSFEAIGAFQSVGRAVLTEAGNPATIRAAWLTPSVLDVLRTRPATGRLFTSGDGESGAPLVVLLSHGFWHSRYGGEPATVGRSVSLNERSYTIAGVLPAGFDFPHPTSMSFFRCASVLARATSAGRTTTTSSHGCGPTSAATRPTPRWTRWPPSSPSSIPST